MVNTATTIHRLKADRLIFSMGSEKFFILIKSLIITKIPIELYFYKHVEFMIFAALLTKNVAA